MDHLKELQPKPEQALEQATEQATEKFTKDCVRIQALVRGFLVRKAFKRLASLILLSLIR